MDESIKGLCVKKTQPSAPGVELKSSPGILFPEITVEEVSEDILQEQVWENIHSKAGVLKYILMEIPL